MILQTNNRTEIFYHRSRPQDITDEHKSKPQGASEVAKKNQILAAEQEAKASLEDKLLKLQNKYQKEI
eukprot:1330900-Amorphochlora_amoeboformis.AAC.1